MKRLGTTTPSVVALALTWDGARWPVRSLPPKARAFLSHASSAKISPKKVAQLLADDQVREIRVCWVPVLKGGEDVLAVPFSTSSGLRTPFRAARTRRFGDILGVVYLR